MINKENLQNFVTRQVIMKPYLYEEASRKIDFLTDKTINDEYDNFSRFDRIVKENRFFYGEDSELENLKELCSLLKVI